MMSNEVSRSRTVPDGLEEAAEKMEEWIQYSQSGVGRIESARIRQINHHGYDSFHDDQHVNGELAAAAEGILAAYALFIKGFAVDAMTGVPLSWPFENEAWKWDGKDMIHNLENAGAFIAAEIDRLNRKGIPNGN